MLVSKDKPSRSNFISCCTSLSANLARITACCCGNIERHIWRPKLGEIWSGDINAMQELALEAVVEAETRYEDSFPLLLCGFFTFSEEMMLQ